MEVLPRESQNIYLLRRIAPNQIPKGFVNSDVFLLREGEKGLSVFDSRSVTPRDALQAHIDMLHDTMLISEGEAQEKAKQRCEKNPDVETLVAKGWRILKIPEKVFRERGFDLSEVEANGHRELLGEQGLFEKYKIDFVNLIEKGEILLLSDEDCLK